MVSSLPGDKHLMERQRNTPFQIYPPCFQKNKQRIKDKFRTKQDLMTQRTNVLFLNTIFLSLASHTHIHTPPYALSWATTVHSLWAESATKRWKCQEQHQTTHLRKRSAHFWSADSGTVYVFVIKINYVDRWSPDLPYFMDLLPFEMNSLIMSKLLCRTNIFPV